MGTYIEFFKDEDKKISSKKKGLTITVSGLSGSGKSTIAEALSKEFELRLVNSGDIYRELAKKKNMTLEKFASTHNNGVDFETDRRSLKLAHKGGVLLVGRLTGWVAGDNADIRIFVKCSLKKRAERVAERDNKGIKKAIEDIERRDIADMGTAKKLYGVDLKDERIYTFVFDNDKLDYESAKKIPVEKVRALLAKGKLI